MRFTKKAPPAPAPRYPGIPAALDGSAAVVQTETAASEAAGAHPVPPAAAMSEGWAAALAAGTTNAHGRPLVFVETEGDPAAVAVTAGLSMAGLRATSFASGPGVAAMHGGLYAAAGKRLTCVLHLACRPMTRQGWNVHAGHDDYHAVDDTGCFQLFGKNVQEVADLTLVAHRIAELSLNPGICAQDGFLTSHVIESVRLPERELIREFLGHPGDLIESPTPAQRLVFGERRRRIPELFDLDYPTMTGTVQNQDSYQRGVAAQRPFYFDHVRELTDRAFDEYGTLTGRRYARASDYRLDGAEYAIVGQGSVIELAEAVCDHLRGTRKLAIGVVNLTMFRPFPADLLTVLLRGTRAVLVLERVDQPLAVDPPLLRELRAAMGQAVENRRAGSPSLPYPDLAACGPDEVPDFYSACFGLGGRDLRPADVIGAVENMLDGGRKRRQFYLGIDFVRPGTRLPKLQIWQERLLDSYPDLASLAVAPGLDVDLRPPGSLAIRIHSISGWGGITLGKTLALAAAELSGLRVKAMPRHGAEKKGLPTTFHITLARDPVRLTGELRSADVVLSPDPSALRHSDPLAGLAEGGVFVLQSDRTDAALWSGLPATAQDAIRRQKLRVFALDGFQIAMEEAPDPVLRHRMQGAAFLGAFFRVAPLGPVSGLGEEKLGQVIRGQLAKTVGAPGERVVEAILRAVRRGYAEARPLDVAAHGARADEIGALPTRPAALDGSRARPGLGHPGRFWEEVGFLHATGQEAIADPFAAIGVLPAATSSIRDMTELRLEVPELVPARCTGCGQCWTQCPDSALPGLVTPIEDVIGAAIRSLPAGRQADRVRQIVRPLGHEARRILKQTPFTTFADVLSAAYGAVAGKLDVEPERRAGLDAEFAAVRAALQDFPLVKAAPFFDGPESAEKGSGGLLSLAVNPETCKGCNLCVEVCPEGALRAVAQTDELVERLRRHRRLWQHLPETEDRYVEAASADARVGVLPALLLKKANYLSMLGGDGACMGCGEKTALHLVLSTINAHMLPRAKMYMTRLDDLIARLDQKARTVLASDADLGHVATAATGTVDIPLQRGKKAQVDRISRAIGDLKDLRWRYAEGPAGRGRATCGIANAAAGCSAVWASTYPVNPYPVPWISHLSQDAPSVALGLFEGHMRKMAGGFAAVRRAELELADEYDPAVHETELGSLDWLGFTDDELALCPPILAVGGDGALLDDGFQSLSRLLASGKPIRVVMLDTQGHSAIGGQASTSSFPGQASGLSAQRAGQRVKEEARKELALLAMAHRDVFVLQSSAVAPAHLVAGVLRGLQSRCPAVFNLYCPCPPEHGLGDGVAARAAKLALESRAFPLLVYDPAAAPGLAGRLSLDGNPAVDAPWPTYPLRYVDDAGAERSMELPVTVADWAATEGRFRTPMAPIPAATDDRVPVAFHEYLGRSAAERAGTLPFIHTLEPGRRLGRLAVPDEIVRLADDRRQFWAILRDMAGLKPPETLALEAEYERKVAAVRADYEAKLADVRTRYPRVIARRLAEGLLRAGNGTPGVADLLAGVGTGPGVPPPGGGLAVAQPAAAAAPAAPAAPPTGAAAAPTVAGEVEVERDEPLTMEPYIDSALCTACNECTNLNKRMFAYDGKKQAYIKDARAGTFKDLVVAAEKCPVRIIHPGTPLNPGEKDLDKWTKRARPFN